MEHNEILDKCRGALVGGAVGDALGYEVEFMSLASIRKKFGQRGISRYMLHDGVAHFSDDTQMTLFTLEGMMNGVIATKGGKPSQVLPYIERSYLAWYETQTGKPHVLPDSWLSHINPLWARRAPGLTCMDSLDNIAGGRPVHNDSKGCGGVMRVAPIGIFNAAHPHLYDYADTALLAGLAAEITHKHIASTFASALLATTVQNCIQKETVDRVTLFCIVTGGLSMMQKYFPGHERELEKFDSLIRRALELGKCDVEEKTAIRELGEGWTGDEAIAIALFAVMRHIDSFEDCIVCAVNHDGDSDSTGAIAGNIIGAILGYPAIPSYFLDALEIEPIIVSAADDLCPDITDPSVTQRLTLRYHSVLGGITELNRSIKPNNNLRILNSNYIKNSRYGTFQEKDKDCH